MRRGGGPPAALARAKAAAMPGFLPSVHPSPPADALGSSFGSSASCFCNKETLTFSSWAKAETFSPSCSATWCRTSARSLTVAALPPCTERQRLRSSGKGSWRLSSSRERTASRSAAASTPSSWNALWAFGSCSKASNSRFTMGTGIPPPRPKLPMTPRPLPRSIARSRVRTSSALERSFSMHATPLATCTARPRSRYNAARNVRSPKSTKQAAKRRLSRPIS
mmetsp:Transcript_52174/g.161923  ORF Transcript_52174/g.161923 Transcript_52174/m.161923 type:complete len:223 (+) Transcript_52174:296-964(+)